MLARRQPLGSRGHDPRLEHGLHRRHGRQRRAAGAPAQPRARRVSDAQWIVEAYSLFLAALVLAGGSLGGPLRPPARVPGSASVDLRGRLPGLRTAPPARALIIRRAPSRASARRCWCRRASRSSAPLSAGGARPRDRHLVRLTSITAAIGPALGGWLVQIAVVARGVPRQPAARRGSRSGSPGAFPETRNPRQVGRPGRRRPRDPRVSAASCTDSSKRRPRAGLIRSPGARAAGGIAVLAGSSSSSAGSASRCFRSPCSAIGPSRRRTC